MSVLPKRSIVLVSGSNGWIASHIVDQLLQAGYNVRGTSRKVAKAQWLKEYVERAYGPGRFEIAVVPDMGVEGAFDEAVDGVSAFIHVASDLSFSSDADRVVNGTLNGINAALSAAVSEPAMKHFVYTSSAAAVCYPKPNVPATLGPETWNDDSARLAWETNSQDPLMPAHIYAASKIAAEKAVWKFAESHEKLVVNTVVPNMNWGPHLAPGRQGRTSSGGLIPLLFEKGIDALGMFRDFPPQYHIDVRDTARLHVAPLLDPEIRNERLFAYNEVYDWEKVLNILHELRPSWRNQDAWKENRRCLAVVVKRPRTEEILRKNFARPGLTSMRDSIEANIAHLASTESHI